MSIDPTKLKDILFKIKKIQFNTYDIVHPTIKGQFRMIVIPQNFVEVPKPPGVKGLPQIGTGSQTIVGFTNRGEKSEPKNPNVTIQSVPEEDKEDITTFVENGNEPWNEFILEGNLLLRLKTVMTKVTWLKNHVNSTGDPMLWAGSSINIEVFENKTGETGLQ